RWWIWTAAASTRCWSGPPKANPATRRSRPRRADGPAAAALGAAGSIRGAGCDEEPGGIARADVARGGPDVGDRVDGAGAAGYDGPVGVGGGVELLGGELDRDPGLAPVQLGFDDLHALDADQGGIETVAGLLALAHGALEVGEHLAAGQRAQCV